MLIFKKFLKNFHICDATLMPKD